jgi:hypothetical protein
VALRIAVRRAANAPFLANEAHLRIVNTWRLAGQSEKSLHRTFHVLRIPAGVRLRLFFIALRYKKKPKPAAADEAEQYQLFDTPEYT